MQPKTFQRSAIALAVAAAFAIGVGVADHVGISATAANAPAPAVAPTPLAQTQSALPAAALPDFSGLVEKYGQYQRGVGHEDLGTHAAHAVSGQR